MLKWYLDILTFFGDISVSLVLEELSNFSNVLLVVVAIYGLYMAKREFDANQSAKLMVSRRYRKLSRSEDNVFMCEVNNKGKGICLDAFMILKSEEDGNEEYFLSNPSREIDPGDSAKLEINFGDTFIARKKIEYIVLYLDFFGDYYTAGGSLYFDSDVSRTSEFTIPAKRASFLKVRKYKKWMSNAKESNNTSSYMNPEYRGLKQAKEAFENWDIEEFFEKNRNK